MKKLGDNVLSITNTVSYTHLVCVCVLCVCERERERERERVCSKSRIKRLNEQKAWILQIM